jgi:hypothetical protein
MKHQIQNNAISRKYSWLTLSFIDHIQLEFIYISNYFRQWLKEAKFGIIISGNTEILTIKPISYLCIRMRSCRCKCRGSWGRSCRRADRASSRTRWERRSRRGTPWSRWDTHTTRTDGCCLQTPWPCSGRHSGTAAGCRCLCDTGSGADSTHPRNCSYNWNTQRLWR